MNIRRKRPPDSLYMLLDTMCNAFGGIILLAVLVTLLTNTEKQNHSETASDTKEMLQRRLALAETNLQESLKLLRSLQAKAGSDRWKQQVALFEKRRRLQVELQQTRDATVLDNKDLETSSASDPSERLKFLNTQLAAAMARQLELQNSLNAAAQNLKRLQQRLAALNLQIIAKYNESVQSLRLPKEHQTGKQVMYIIARYGQIYPCRNSDMSRNEASISWTSDLGSDTAEPIRGKGMDSATGYSLQSYFNSQDKNSVYVVFCVFEDSFPAFIRAKKLAVASGLEYGWEPFREQDGPVTFGEHGHTPNPQ
jgi:hypothetical protein